MQISFIQSNWLRQYPFRDNNGEIDLNSNLMPSSLIVGLRITCLASDLELYINKVTVNQGMVSINFAGSSGDIGYANGTITDDNQSLIINSYASGVIGTVMIGDAALTNTQQTYLFDNTNGLLEPSTVIVLPVPGVTSLAISGKSAYSYVGDLEFTSKSVNLSVSSSLFWSVKNPAAITSRGDKHAELLTCNNNVISGINTVIPDADGNIDIYAIAPLSVSVSTINGVTQLVFNTSLLGLNETEPLIDSSILNLCKIANIPPVNTSSTYGTTFSDITSSTLPEYESWPQYE